MHHKVFAADNILNFFPLRHKIILDIPCEHLLADDSHDLSRLIFPKFKKLSSATVEERGGSVVECLTQDRGAAGLRLTRGTALCP